jgi:hypothetical protein
VANGDKEVVGEGGVELRANKRFKRFARLWRLRSALVLAGKAASDGRNPGWWAADPGWTRAREPHVFTYHFSVNFKKNAMHFLVSKLALALTT